MENEILSYLEMCAREGASLQRGMNSFEGRPYAVILMSVRSDAKYQDRLEDDGATLIYEGHDAPARSGDPDPKSVDQPEATPAGSLTENGKFHRFAQSYQRGEVAPRLVRVYEKIRKGIWSFNGHFALTNSWIEHDGRRQVFRFRLEASEVPAGNGGGEIKLSHRRVIPPAVKLDVWKRDRGKCVKCGSPDELHFDHILPHSKGGTSLLTENVQLLCARHNLMKRDRIE
ncbi:MAG: HNH endonuclease [Armatimonadetes bacterium]|nr:MAG: HNH endonuclease [Armatimonadota bacterium]